MRSWSRSGPRPSRGSSVKPRMALSKAWKDGTRPMRKRSSGTCRRPSCRMRCGLCCVDGRSRARRAASCRGPAGACRRALRASSLWPLPATPAMPTISPARTVKETLATRSTPRSSMTDRLSTSSSGAPGSRVPTSRRAAARAGRPSARPVPAARCAAVSRVATISPRRMTETRSVDRHDLAQLVGDEDDGLALRPSAPAAVRTDASASGGVSTAVGSSRMRMSAPR